MMLDASPLPAAIDISADWCAATGEAGCHAMAYLRHGQLTEIRLMVAPGLTRPILMNRCGAMVLMSCQAVNDIETRHARLA